MVILGKYMGTQILKEYRYYGNEVKGTTKGDKGPFLSSCLQTLLLSLIYFQFRITIHLEYTRVPM